MSKSLITLCLSLISLNVWSAASPEIDRIYSDYSINRQILFSKNINRSNLKTELEAFIKRSTLQLEAIQAIEEKAKTEPENESAKGHQIAFDISRLDPLVEFANGPMDSEKCKATISANSIEGVDSKVQNVVLFIDSTLKKICK